MRRRQENIEKSNGGKQREIRKRKEEVGVSAQGKKRTVATATISSSRTFASRLNVAASSTANTKEQKEKNNKIEGRIRDSRRKVEGKYREGGRTTSSVHRKPLSVLLFAHCQQQHRHRMSASPSFIFLFSFSTCNPTVYVNSGELSMFTRPDRTGPDQNGWAGLGPVQKNLKKKPKKVF